LHETTVEEYRACVEAGACTVPHGAERNTPACTWNRADHDQYPSTASTRTRRRRTVDGGGSVCRVSTNGAGQHGVGRRIFLILGGTNRRPANMRTSTVKGRGVGSMAHGRLE